MGCLSEGVNAGGVRGGCWQCESKREIDEDTMIMQKVLLFWYLRIASLLAVSCEGGTWLRF